MPAARLTLVPPPKATPAPAMDVAAQPDIQARLDHVAKELDLELLALSFELGGSQLCMMANVFEMCAEGDPADLLAHMERVGRSSSMGPLPVGACYTFSLCRAQGRELGSLHLVRRMGRALGVDALARLGGLTDELTTFLQTLTAAPPAHA